MLKPLKSALYLLPLWLHTEWVHADLLRFFKDPDGDTKWQYVANFSSGVLIILLLIVAINLFLSQRKTNSANRALEIIRDQLEIRVKERTATLDEYNKLLKDTNMLLEGEIAHHKETSSRLQSSETYINSILESMPLVLIGLDKNNLVTHWNNLAARATHVDRQKALGKNLWEVYPTITLTSQQLGDVIEKGKPTTLKHCQSGQYYFEITIYPLHGSDEVGVVILIDDVTHQKLSENKLIQRDKMSSMGELASAMAHDIENPLKQILNNITSVEESLTSYIRQQDGAAPNLSQSISLLVDANNKGELAFAIINNLLDFSREFGDNKRFVYMPDIVENALELAGNLVSEPSGLRFKDIIVEKRFAKELPTVPCYVSEMLHVFLSLFRHSLNSMGKVSRAEYEPHLKIEVAFHYEALWIKVQHNGIGLTAEEQNTVFEPFYVDTAGAAGSPAGQRLSFSNFIITEHHRGQIAVTSDINSGTTFHVQLQFN